MKNPNPQSETPLNPVNPGHNPAPCQTAVDCYANDRDKINPNDHKNNHKEKIMGQSTPFNPTQNASEHIPFEDPELEAYWNRPCRSGKYPYPDENVFLVSGARFKGEHFESVAESSIIVSLRPDLAQSYYVDIADDDHLKVISCLSLMDAKALKHRMSKASAGNDCVKIKPSLMNALFFKSC